MHPRIYHNSQEEYYRSPFGAVPCGTEVGLRLRVGGEDPVEWVHVVCRENSGGTSRVPLELEKAEGTERVYRGIITAPSRPDLLWYYFALGMGGRTFYYGNNFQRLGGEGVVLEQVPPAYQITVHKENIRVPRWFTDSVMYQIFVDRFYNGNEDGRVLNPKKGSLIHGNWDDTPLYIREPGSNNILRWDYFGGNLAGVRKKLPYLKELGIGVIYFNPIHEASSNHRYDTGDYLKVDPMYGTNEEFGELCREAAEYGIKIILDGVFSHTGSDSIYFNK
jgi:cyclomaltodextrinase